MKVFYGMYYDALQGIQVSSRWKTHFKGPPAPIQPDSMEAVQHSVRTGVIAHIQGDMPVALEISYKTWAADPKPAFHDLREEFIKSEGAFRAAEARFYIEVNDKTFSPLRPEVGQFAAATYQKSLNIQPSLTVVFQWRQVAWRNAAEKLKS